MEKKKGIIYKAQNQHNKRVYIGATTGSVEARKQDHLQKASTGQGSSFQEAIRTYGPDAFTWEQIDTAENIQELAHKERQYILQYQSLTQGYNNDAGGGIPKMVYQYDGQSGSLIASYDSLSHAAEAVGAAKTSISNACLGYTKSCMSYLWNYQRYVTYPMGNDKRKKSVVQFTLSGFLVAHYHSVAQASRATGLSKTCIARVCRGEREQSGGYRWYYFG